MTINSLKRYERKWVFSNFDFNQICIYLFRSHFFFKEQYQNRKVNSIYFDDLNYSSIKQNLDGVSDKKKYRIRWYGDYNILRKPIFEIKSKKGFEVQKKNCLLNELENYDLLKSDDLNRIKICINDKFKFKNELIPILSTHYLRHYFISSNNLVRATVDKNLKSLSFVKNLGFMKEYTDLILEMKYDLNLDSFVRKNIDSIPVRFSKISKFINAATNAPNFLS
jgi:hypothetical protein